MEFVTFRDLSLSPKESRDVIEFIAQKRNVNNYKGKSDGELLSAIKEKSKNLTTKKPSKNPKRKITENLIPKKPPKNLKRKITENLTPEKPLKNPKRENNRILTSKNKERIDIIREKQVSSEKQVKRNQKEPL